MDQQTYLIRFKDIADANASLYAQELKNELLDASPDVQVERKSETPRAQDIGNLLEVIFSGVATAAAIAQAVIAWRQLHQQHNVTLEIEKPDGRKLTLTVPNKEDRKALEEFLKKQ